MDKVYTLPDLPPAPSTDLQLLVRRLVEGDLSTVHPILDELKALGREADAGSLKIALMWVANHHSSNHWNDHWNQFIRNCVSLFWYDLFSLEGTLEKAQSMRPTPNPHPMKIDATFWHAMEAIEKASSDVGWPTPATNSFGEDI